MSFYPNVKESISPSAIATWHNSRPSFISHYFKGEKSVETSYMIAGTKIHGLIEAGFLKTEKRFEKNEKIITAYDTETGVQVLGKPDSFKLEEEIKTAFFVDYKTGNEVSWTRDELAKDMKMRATAWLVWKECLEPEKVVGYIGWIGTTWNGTEIVPTSDEYMIIKYEYSASELKEFEATIRKTIYDVNECYERFLASDGVVVVDDSLCEKYAQLYDQIKEIENGVIAPLEFQMSEIKKIIEEQMVFGNTENHAIEEGSFYWKTSKRYEYPPSLKTQVDGTIYTLDTAEKLEKAISVVKKMYETSNNPVEEKRTLQFRAKRKK